MKQNKLRIVWNGKRSYLLKLIVSYHLSIILTHNICVSLYVLVVYS